MKRYLFKLLLDARPLDRRSMVESVIPGIWKENCATQSLRMHEYLREVELSDLKETIADTMIRETDLGNTVPDCYSDFRPVLIDGVRFLLSRFPEPRLKALCISQLLLDPQMPAGSRLLELVGTIPTLFKLGQIIARHPGLDPCMKPFLTSLENGMKNTDLAWAKGFVEREILENSPKFSVRVGEEILGEASVGVVLPLVWWRKDGGESGIAVAKILRSHVGDDLREELDILDPLAEYLEGRREAYALGKFSFRAVFREIKEALLREIDLAREQSNLEKAILSVSAGRGEVAVPRVHTLSTPAMTVMEMADGEKITGTPFRGDERREATRKLFRGLILEPLFSRKNEALFHGDPHAGNIFASQNSGSGLRVTVLDWSQTGLLSKKVRFHLLQIGAGILTMDKMRIMTSTGRIAETSGLSGTRLFELSYGAIQKTREESRTRRMSLLHRVFSYIDALILEGIGFSQDLLLFRKALFTLEGVLLDILPEFSMDAEMQAFLGELLVQEAPRRCLNLFFSSGDSYRKYPSLFSNLDLQGLLASHVVSRFDSRSAND